MVSLSVMRPGISVQSNDSGRPTAAAGAQTRRLPGCSEPDVFLQQVTSMLSEP